MTEHVNCEEPGAFPNPSDCNAYGYTDDDLRSMQEVRMAFKALTPELQAIVLPQLCAEHSYYASGGKIDGDRRRQ